DPLSAHREPASEDRLDSRLMPGCRRPTRFSTTMLASGLQLGTGATQVHEKGRVANRLPPFDYVITGRRGTNAASMRCPPSPCPASSTMNPSTSPTRTPWAKPRAKKLPADHRNPPRQSPWSEKGAQPRPKRRTYASLYLTSS